jgi:hypothetical protein
LDAKAISRRTYRAANREILGMLYRDREPKSR